MDIILLFATVIVMIMLLALMLILEDKSRYVKILCWGIILLSLIIEAIIISFIFEFILEV